MNEAKSKKMLTFVVDDLPLHGYPVMDQIRKDSKLCDVQIKVQDDEKKLIEQLRYADV